MLVLLYYCKNCSCIVASYFAVLFDSFSRRIPVKEIHNIVFNCTLIEFNRVNNTNNVGLKCVLFLSNLLSLTSRKISIKISETTIVIYNKKLVKNNFLSYNTISKLSQQRTIKWTTLYDSIKQRTTYTYICKIIN